MLRIIGTILACKGPKFTKGTERSVPFTGNGADGSFADSDYEKRKRGQTVFPRLRDGCEIGETPVCPAFSRIFRTVAHVNSYLIPGPEDLAKYGGVGSVRDRTAPVVYPFTSFSTISAK